MTQNRFLDSSREFFVCEIEKLRARGAQACILGCTEIPLLVRSEDTDLPLIDTVQIHARAGMDWACAT